VHWDGCLFSPYTRSSRFIAAPINTVALAFGARAALWASLRPSQQEIFFAKERFAKLPYLITLDMATLANQAVAVSRSVQQKEY
jgi:hypothetical protein